MVFVRSNSRIAGPRPGREAAAGRAARLALAAALLAAVVIGCDRVPAPADAPASPAPSAPSAGVTPIRWGVFKNYQPYFIADELKLFEAEGVRVDPVGSYTSGPAIIQAAAAGSVDAGHCAITGIVDAVRAGVEVTGVADSQTEFADAPLMQWYVLADSPIRAPADLRGRRVAVNSLAGSFYSTVLVQLEKVGLGPSDVSFVLVPHHNQEQALRSGQVDVASLIDPYTSHIVQAGGVRTLFKAVEVIGERQFSLVFFRKDFLARDRESVVRFLRAYRKAIAYIRDHPKEASATMAKRLGVAAELVGVHRFTPAAEVRPGDVEFWLGLMRRTGELKDGGALQAAEVCDPSLNEP